MQCNYGWLFRWFPPQQLQLHVWVDRVGFIVADTHKSPTKLRLRILGNRKDSKEMEKGRRFRFLLWLGQNQGIWAPSSTLSWVGCNLRDSSTTDRSHLLWGLPSRCAIKDPPTVGIGSPFIAGLDWDRSIKWRYSSFIIYSINLLELHAFQWPSRLTPPNFNLIHYLVSITVHSTWFVMNQWMWITVPHVWLRNRSIADFCMIFRFLWNIGKQWK